MAFQITKNDRYLVFGDFNIPKKIKENTSKQGLS